MAFGTSTGQGKPIVWLDLKSSTKKMFAEGKPLVGFRQTIGSEADPADATKRIYQHALHDYVDGKIVGFRVSKKLDANKVEQLYGSLRFADGGPQDPIVTFPLTSSFGRRLVGLINAAQIANAGDVCLYTNFAKAGTKFGDGKPFESDRAFISLKGGLRADKDAQKFNPVWVKNANGETTTDFPEATQVMVGGKPYLVNGAAQWDHSAQDELVAFTALALQERFQTEVPATEHAADDIDLDEAASAAAAPRP